MAMLSDLGVRRKAEKTQHKPELLGFIIELTVRAELRKPGHLDSHASHQKVAQNSHGKAPQVGVN